MPIYEYQCQHCQHQLDMLQKLNEAPLVDCPECGKSTLKKQVSAAGFRLKGTGWYETDFKDNKKTDAGTDTQKTDKKEKVSEKKVQTENKQKDT